MPNWDWNRIHVNAVDHFVWIASNLQGMRVPLTLSELDRKNYDLHCLVNDEVRVTTMMMMMMNCDGQVGGKGE